MNLKKNLIAAAGVVGAAAIAIPLSGVVAAPAMGAPDSVSWSDGNSSFERSVSDSTPAVGDTITVTTRFQRKASDEYIYNYKDLTNSCLNYVAGSAKWEGGSIASVNSSVAGEVRVEAPNVTSWRVPLGGTKRSISVQYTVTGDCATGDGMLTTMHYGGSLGSGIYNNPKRGPVITVAKINKTNSSTSVSVNPSPRATVASTVTARISATGKTPTGSVDFFNNGTKIGTGAVSNGTASTTWTPNAAGAYSIKAVYSGDAYLNASTSEIDSGTVAAAPGAEDPANATDLDLSTSATVAPGTKVTVTGKAGARTTKVAIKVGGVDQPCSPVTVTAGGTFSCEFTTTSAMDGKTVTVTPYNGMNAGATQTAGRLSVETGDNPGDGENPGDGGDNTGGSLGGILGGAFGSLG
ncbi:Ig-like domain-containing protein [Gordonia sp. (in: high G+C Gram-positive bacteria)]|uniref:Ig-like domain-containing protein n=1 Tax=Gordonia sp. (in: high G+C Gram-positive bacteria) TaxID=84139 RepID=UPI003C72C3E0